MTVNPINTNASNTPQVTGAQGQGGDEAFQRDLTKSEGYNQEELKQAVSERTRLTRTRKAGITKSKQLTLFGKDLEEEELSEDPVYRTVMVDGVMYTLRLIAVA